jgi:hypothetical protein
MEHINVQLSKEDWDTVLSWYGTLCGEGTNKEYDDEVLKKIEQQINK